MEAVTGQQTEVNKLWEEIKPKINALITQRINLFHDALVERQQISPKPIAPKPEER